MHLPNQNQMSPSTLKMIINALLRTVFAMVDVDIFTYTNTSTNTNTILHNYILYTYFSC